MKKNSNTETNKRIKELEKEIQNLNTALGYSQNMTEIMSHNYDQANSERINYRRIIRYYSLLMVLANLLTQNDGKTDIDRILKQNILDFYKAMTKDLMNITEDEDESFDDEEEYDTEPGEEEF
jgi:IS5 family transposase